MNVGIDLGTSYSLVARVQEDGAVALMPDYAQQDLFHTPSVVAFRRDDAYVGRLAEMLLDDDPHVTALRLFKRRLGSAEPMYYASTGAGWRPEAIAALVLKKLRYDGESFGRTAVSGAVLTVPAHFTDPQRRALLGAALLADVPVLGLLEEPVAAALHYGATAEPRDRVILVFDWGGGTFDVTVVGATPSSLSVLAKGGANDLGGKEVDDAVGALILNAIPAGTFAGTPSARALLDLSRAAEEIKIDLGGPGRGGARRAVLIGEHPLEVTIDAATFAVIVEGLLERCEEIARRCLSDAGLKQSDVDLALLVGGSSMLPGVRARLEALFPGRIRYHEPGKAVAFGAAIHAAQLSGDAPRLNLPAELRGLTGHATAFRTVEPTTGRVQLDIVVAPNLPLPIRVTRTYFTSRPDQQRVALEVIQTPADRVGETMLGRLVIGPLPEPRVNYPIEVTVDARLDGTIAVTAYDAGTGIELAQVFSRPEDQAGGGLALQHALVRETVVNNL